jgi:hypothetical protein
MTAYTGNQEVEPGLYLNLRTFTVANVEKAGPLPGTGDDRYRRVPMLLMLAAAPLMGLAYVVFLPFIGFVAVGYLLGGKAMQFASTLADQFGRVRRPAWAPLVAFLSRSKPATTATPEDTAPESDAWKDTVEKALNETDRPER